MAQQKLQASVQTSCPLDFVIVGGGIAGLACAIGLTRVGHRALILEQSDGVSNRREGGIRMPPNLAKLLYKWGLKQKLREFSLACTSVLLSRYESGEILGKQDWDANEDADGTFELVTHADLHRLLTETANVQEAQIRYNADVVEIHPEKREIKLSTGEKIKADVIVGADGERGIARRTLLGYEDSGRPIGLAVYDGTFSTTRILSTVEIQRLVDLKSNPVHIALGNGKAAVELPIHKHRELAFLFLMCDGRNDGTWQDPPSVELAPLVSEPCDPRLRTVALQCESAVRISALDYDIVRNWVDDSENMVLIGQAAHPFVPASLQGTAMAVEDGAVLSNLFAHLSSREQIASFLWAFQDLRQPRCEKAREADMNILLWMTLEDGPEQEQRDDDMRAKFKAGKDVLDAHAERDEDEVWQELKDTFGYDAKEQADAWLNWQQLRGHAKHKELADSILSNIPSKAGQS